MRAFAELVVGEDCSVQMFVEVGCRIFGASS
jgi:hypothetical protein